MKTIETFRIGQTVVWSNSSGTHEGVVKDDLGKAILVTIINRSGRRIKEDKKVEKKFLKSGKMDIAKVIMTNKYKKWAKAQLIEKYPKTEGAEKEVIGEILSKRGVDINTLGEIEEPEIITPTTTPPAVKKVKKVEKVEKEKETKPVKEKIKAVKSTTTSSKEKRVLTFTETIVTITINGEIISVCENINKVANIEITQGEQKTVFLKKGREVTGEIKSMFFDKFAKQFLLTIKEVETGKLRWISFNTILSWEA